MEYSGFGKKSGPSSSTNPNSSHLFFGNVSPSPPNPSSSTQRSPRPFVQQPMSFGDVQRPLGYNGAQSQAQRPSYSSMATSIVKSRSSDNNVSLRVSRSQQDSSRSLNQSAPLRSNVSAGGFRPSAAGIVPPRQYVPPRTHSPEFDYSKNNYTVAGFRPSSVGVGPVRHLARPRTNSPEQARRSNQFVDLDSSLPPPTGTGPLLHLARPRSISPELSSRNNQFVDLDSFPPLSVGVGSERHTARPRTSSPEVAPRGRQFVDLDSFSHPVGPGPVRHVAPQRTRTPEMDFNINHPVEGFRSSGGVAPVRPVSFPHSFDGRARSPVSYANLQDIQDQPTVLPYDSERSQFVNVRSTNQSKYPDGSLFNENSRFPQNNSKGPSFNHSPALGTNFSTQDSRAPQRSLPRASNNVTEAAPNNPTSFPVMKRTRSPPLLSNSKATNENFSDIQDDEREMLAKAKRLARFKVELGENVQSSNDHDTEHKVSTNLHEPSIAGRNKSIPEHSTDVNEDFSSELEGSKPPGVIIGLCTEMCPASERAERERKGDLDRFERLDGDRNQTSKNLAVKKYTRTAEREANLIRPMPTLQKTMEYLLNLLDQPYDDGFLGTYNFLWDRMRAIRMDLRMQHIFNQDAITMLEQMIRLHIIVMHELCEYSKGEGFSEGFDAHLNIEQMNKTSVELFQMYDDHRKKGLLVSTEKEFRGYYALLKLDKHPGYMVEPGELSLDLAKMTPEIRQTNEVLFARDVARACRTGNFIAFFRLARRASYLQACLMHAHFAKLRTQALASLHAGLQNNQGLPIIHVAKWLAMEEEDMESLLEYHGFAVKVFDEPYMVKDGAFLNGDKDYDTRCSKLVDMKKSESIVEDVAPSTEVISPTKVYKSTYQSLARKTLPTKTPKAIDLVKKNDGDIKVIPSGSKKRSVHDVLPVEVSSPVYVDDEDMADYEAGQSPEDSKVMQPIAETPIPSQHLAGFNNFSRGFSSPKPFPSEVSDDRRPILDTPFSNFSQRNMHAGTEAIPSQFISKPIVQDSFLDAQPKFVVEKPVPQELVTEVEEEKQEEPPIFLEESENEDVVADYLDEEIAEAKLKLILRTWKRRASRKRDLREQKQFAANAALNLLPLGPLVQLKRETPNILDEFDIDNALRERYKNHEQSWSRLNVSEETSGTLSRKSPDAKCLCWKIIVNSQVNKPEEAYIGQSSDSAVSSWLLSKLMPSNNYNGDDGLLISSPGLSIWKKWTFGQSYTDQTCCLSVVKEVNFYNPIESVAGASAVLFLVCDSIPWNLQKANLQRLIMPIPPGSSLPLLLLSSSFKYEASDYFNTALNELGLHDIDNSRISSFNFISLIENPQMEYSDGFFSDNRLRQGLQWLASESPPQLILRRVKTRDLVLTHLSPSMEALEGTNYIELSPNDCVRVYNEALDRSLANIDSAAKANRNSWPCPEIALLEESSSEHRFAVGFVPENGWSSVDRIEPLVSAFQNSKLPLFEDDLSYLTHGSNTREEIEIRRVEFGNSLVRYLNESSRLMGFSLAVKEAGIMLQSCRLELRGSLFYIVPDWAIIFRRIFNWRLTSVTSEALSSAYILECPDTNSLFDGPDDSRLEDDRLSSHRLNRPTLDEMIEVSCRLDPFSNGQPVPEANQVFHQATCSASDLMEDDSEVDREFTEDVTSNGVREVGGSERVNNEAERLSKLLEKCNILQNMIDDKLSVYF